MKNEDLQTNFERYLRSSGQRSSSIESRVKSLNLFLRWLDSHSLNPLGIGYSDILSYINYNKAQGNSKRTINWKLQSLTSFYTNLQQQDIVDVNPVDDIRLKGVSTRQPHSLLSWEDLENLYQSYPSGNLIGKRNKLILSMLIYQGLNSGDLASIELNDVDLEAAKLHVSALSRTNSRVLKLESTQILQLQKYTDQLRFELIKEKNCSDTNKLFVGSANGALSANDIAYLIRKARKQNTAVESLKQIRSSVLTHWLTKYSLREVQYMAGHRYVSSTEHYRTDLLNSLQDQLEELHPLK